MTYDISQDSISDSLNTKLIGNYVVYLDSVESTMDIAADLAIQGAAEGTIVIAEEQIKGRGRFDRTWMSPSGKNLYMSLILYPDMRYLHQISMMCAVSIVDTLSSILAEESSISIKWPNDVRVSGKKIAGILVENRILESSEQISIIGIGLNINFDTTEIAEISEIATSISGELGYQIGRLEVINSLCSNLERLYFGIQSGESIKVRWENMLDTIGKRIKLSSGEDIIEGLASSVDEEGNLLLILKNGESLSVNAGEVTSQM
ncbi:MAG: biotin--[acetyl-CoA-carboxylase] ligase [SAR202 cluster bacterium]|nr:biotin--[acetyl-CoA-carboxylase] ligase [SAR202 cluster bacterium]|tara:strand:- start:11176 stop:11961 length:786 start_codon:yes stop_codon:yes gene_type:complete